MPFFLLGDEYTGILLQLLKSGMGTLLAFEKLDERSIGFWIASREYKHTFQKLGEVLSQLLKTQMKFKSYLSTLLKNFKQE